MRGHLSGQPTGLSASAERSREIGGGQPALLELNVADKRKSCPEVCEPLMEIQHPMLCSRPGDTWQMGTTSIREDQLIASVPRPT